MIVLVEGRPGSSGPRAQRGSHRHRRRPHRGDRAGARRPGAGDDHRRDRLLRRARVHRRPRARRRGTRHARWRRCGRADRRAAAALRRHRVLPDDGRLSARRSARVSAAGPRRARRPRVRERARAAGASREQLHQPRLPRRAAGVVPARRPAPTAQDGAYSGTRHPRCDRGVAARRRHRDAGARAAGRHSISSRRSWRPGIVSRSGTRAPTSTRRSPRSRPARGMPRISSTG